MSAPRRGFLGKLDRLEDKIREPDRLLLDIYRRRLAWCGSGGSVGYDGRTMVQTEKLLREAGEVDLARERFGDSNEEMSRQSENE